MKAIDILCASQAATSISTTTTMTMDSNGGGRAIDRHNPIIQDEKRLTRSTLVLPPMPVPSPTPKTTKNKMKKTTKNKDQKTKTIAFADENNDFVITSNYVKNNPSSSMVRRQGGVLLGWGCTRPGDFISPATSSRYLLTDKALSDQVDPLLNQVPSPPPPLPAEKLYNFDKSFRNKKDDGHLSSASPPKSPPRSSSSTLSSQSSDHQVVVLRVSLHCKGCVKKMRKHLSKMEGVTSFNIDFMAKKVTVVGHVTPLSVLTSISKVKNAKLLTPTTISTPPINSDFSEIKKQLGLVR